MRSAQRTARIAGGLYLSLLPFGFFSFVYVPSVLLARGDAATTSRNILASAWLFRAGTVSHLISQILVVFLVLALYRLLRPVNEDHAAVMVVLALIGIPIAFASEISNLAALRVLAGTTDGAFTPAQIHAQAMLFLNIARNGVLLAQIFWGLWMLPLASLVFRSQFLPRLLCVPVLIASVGYLIDSGTQLLLPGAPTISQFTFVAELVLPLWLVIKEAGAGQSLGKVGERNAR